MSSKMEQIIEEIEDYIDGCKPSPISRNKILVNREQLEELLSELRTKTPEEVKRYQKIISNKEAILADAQAKADQIIAQAQIQTNELVSEHQIMQQAYAQANEVVQIATKQAQEILDNATNEANNLRMRKPRNTTVATMLAIHFRRGYQMSLPQPTDWNIDHTPCVRWNQRAKNQTR